MKRAIPVALLLASVVHAASISPTQAKEHLGEDATVCGIIASEHTALRSRGQPTFLNIGAPYPYETFTALVWGDNRGDIGQLPSQGSHICVTGLITEYRGVPQIVLRSSSQISR